MAPSLTPTHTGIELDRKQLKQPDPFTTVVKNFFEKFMGRQKVIVVILGALFVGFGVTFYFTKRAERSNLARNGLFQAKQTLAVELKVFATASVPPQAVSVQNVKMDTKKGADTQDKGPDLTKFTYQKLEVDRVFAKTIPLFQEVISKWEGTRAAFDARLTLGDLYFDHGEASKAVKWYEGASQIAPGAFEKALALVSLGVAHENSKKSKEALGALEAALNLGQEGLKGEILLAMARSLEQLGEKAKAKEKYQQIISQLSNTEQARAAEVQSALLE